MAYALLLAVIRSLVEGIEKVVPWFKGSALRAQVLVAVLSTAFVLAFGLNAPKEFGIPSRYLFFDYALTVVAVWLATLVGHDLFVTVKANKERAQAEAAMAKHEAMAKGVAP